MKNFRAILCLISLVCLYGNVVIAHPYDVYPNIYGNSYVKPSQTPPYSQPYNTKPPICDNSVYPNQNLPYYNPYNCPSWNYNTNSCDGRKIYVQSPNVVYDNGGLIPIGNFIERAGKNYFMYLDGVFARNTWLNKGGKWYYFDNSSEMLRGWVTINGLTYYFNNDGSMATGTTVIDGVTHYFDAVGTKVF